MILLMVVFGCSIEVSGQGTEANEPQARDNLNKGVQAFRESRYDLAIEYFKKATALNPDIPDGELYLATAYAQQFVPGLPSPENQKTADLAVQGFQKVLQKDPSNKFALGGIASIYQNNGLYEKARDAYKKFSEVDSQNHIPFYGVGSVDWILVHNEKSRLSPEEKGQLIEEGLRYLDKALALSPDYEDTLWYENLLVREKAKLLDDKIKVTTDTIAVKEMKAESEALNARADEFSNRALEVRKKNAEKKIAPDRIGTGK
jgi:tetratricopeptide (TPR) repeat protein